MQQNKFFLIAFCVFIYSLQATHISRLKEVMRFIKPGKRTVTLLDIDNTLLQPKTDLGSDQWFSNLMQQKMSEMNKAEALKHVLPLYFHVNHHIDLIPTEEELEQTISSIKQSCTHTLCLTARSLQLMERTLGAFQQNNLNFHIPEINSESVQLPGESVYKNGILFCGSNDKGEIVLVLLKTIDYLPEVIVFVDDKQYNLDSVGNAIQHFNTINNTDIKFIGLRYKGCDDRVKAFDPIKTAQELQEFLLKHPLF